MSNINLLSILYRSCARSSISSNVSLHIVIAVTSVHRLCCSCSSLLPMIRLPVCCFVVCGRLVWEVVQCTLLPLVRFHSRSVSVWYCALLQPWCMGLSALREVESVICQGASSKVVSALPIHASTPPQTNSHGLHCDRNTFSRIVKVRQVHPIRPQRVRLIPRSALYQRCAKELRVRYRLIHFIVAHR